MNLIVGSGGSRATYSMEPFVALHLSSRHVSQGGQIKRAHSYKELYGKVITFHFPISGFTTFHHSHQVEEAFDAIDMLPNTPADSSEPQRGELGRTKYILVEVCITKSHPSW